MEQQKQLELKQLIHQRGQVKARVTVIVKKLNEALENIDATSLAQLKATEKKLELHYAEYIKKHDEVMLMCTPANVEEQDAKLEEFDALHTDALVKLNQLIDDFREEAVRNDTGQRIIVQQQPLKAPIPTFSGKYEEWPKFKALFNDLIGRCGDSDATKLHYLDRALVGEASGILDAQVINDNNYERAWMLLEERFENPRVIIDTHITGLLNMKPIGKCNFKELRNLLDTCNRHVEGLRYMNQPVEGTAALIVTKLLTMCLDGDTRKQWEQTMVHGELPDLGETLKFLKNCCQVLERCDADKTLLSQKVAKPTRPKSVPSWRNANAAAAGSNGSCDFCSQQHLNYKCPSFANMNVEERVSRVKEENLCFNCLRKGHRSSACSSEKTCSKCAKKHHTMLHFPSSNSNAVQSDVQLEEENVTPVSDENPVSASCSGIRKQVKQVLLMTIMVNVASRSGRQHKLRALLDSGSQVNLVSEAAVKTLALPKYSTNVPVVGVGGVKSQIKHRVLLRMSSDYSDFVSNVDCLVTPKVTGRIPSVPVDVSKWSFPPGITLADPNFNKPCEVDLLIGAELFFAILRQAQLKLADNLPTLYDTKFGWVVAGAQGEMDSEEAIVMCLSSEERLDQQIQRFFDQEEVPETTVSTNEERAVEEHFRQTFRREEDGRFVVQLPFRDNIKLLGDSRQLAMKRFFLLEKRLSKNPEMKRQYQDFIDEYCALGHCNEIHEAEDTPGLQSYYLPHHAVLRPASSSTKLRVVFDATAKANGLSLNEVLMVGPTIQKGVFFIVLRFRLHIYVFSADVSKMYRQVRMDPNHRRYLRIFWRNNPGEKLRVLELSTVTYGTSAAPFQAVRSMVQLARDESVNYPEASRVIQEDCYMDDILTGASTLAAIKQLREDVEDLMLKGQFPIRKWCSNNDNVLEGVPEEHREKLVPIEECSANETIKTLGLVWNPKSDQFLFLKKLECVPEDVNITKRYILSQIAKLFDPLGFISPVIVLAKVIMQKLWTSSLGWDDSVDGDLLIEWKVFHESLINLNDIQIPRCVVVDEFEFVEMHGFSDASLKAYGACVYLRCIRKDGTVSVRLLCSKSRVAPIRGSTIPRLELCGALLLSRLVSKIIPELKMDFRDVKLWSDSQVVLAWRRKGLDQLQVYVRNRVIEINELTGDYQWAYVRSVQNPADILSRGCSPEDLKHCDMWWNGPPFLRDIDYEVESTPDVPEELIPELKQIVVTSSSATVEGEPVLERFSSFSKLQRVLAQVVRFIRLVRTPKEKRSHWNNITVQDMQGAMGYIIRALQQTGLREEIQCLKRGVLPKRLAGLQPFIDEKGFVRVGGRLQNSLLPFDAKHQFLIPRDHHVTKLLIRQYHEERLHDGPSGLLAAIRQRFWITDARSAIRKVTRSCISCFKVKPRKVQPLMGNLPEDRVSAVSPFELTGVDYAGPVMVKEGRHKPKHVKAYISLFVCLTTKAIHLELVSDLTTEAFLAALDRFVNRRGLVRKIMSDNATNFAGASKELHQLFLMFRDDVSRAKINDSLLKREIEWEFIPPRSPNFGGLWEAGVKVVKSHLTRTLGNAVLTFEEFATVLTHVEAIVNSRPLYALSEDPNEPLPITPAHLLHLKPLEPVAKPSLTDVPTNRLSRWQYLTYLRDQFWKKWSQNYLSTLQERAKWTQQRPNVKLGTIVLLMEDNQPVQSWRMGRIVGIHPGRDGQIRVADVKTMTGVFRRAVSKLAPLPIPDAGDSLECSSNRGENVRDEQVAESPNSLASS